MSTLPVGPDPNEPAAFTDVVMLLHLEGLTHEDETQDGAVVYDASAMVKASISAFAFGSAVGIEFPTLIRPILEQTHPGEVDAIMADCQQLLKEQLEEATTDGGTIEAGLFLDALFEGIEEDEVVEQEAAYNMISISFEFGCVLAAVDRRAAQMVRNAYNRSQKLTLKSIEEVEEEEGFTPLEPGRPLQDTVKDIVSAYQADIGFGPRPLGGNS